MNRSKEPNETDFSKYRAVVVDDEPLPRLHLARLLEESGVGEVLQSADAAQCLQILANEADSPTWLFLDIRMAGLDGMALADAVRATGKSSRRLPAIVFVTGYEDYAVQAFERAATDYLLKPVRRERLAETLRRLATEPDMPQESLPSHTELAQQRLPIRTDYAVKLVPIDQIVAAFAHDKRVEIVTEEASYATYYTLGQLEARLPADRFLRVHDGWIVNLSEVLEIHNLGGQTYQLRLRRQSQLVPVSRRRIQELHRRLGL